MYGVSRVIEPALNYTDEYYLSLKPIYNVVFSIMK